MHIRIRSIASTFVCLSAVAALIMGSTRPAAADGHLPIIDIVPTSSFTLTSDGIDENGGPKNPAATNGDFQINGTATIPISKAFSISYDRISLGAFDSSLSAVVLGGHRIFPGASRDLLQNYRADYHLGAFNIEGGFGSRYRRCCPADAIEWHKGFLGVSYVTRHLSILNGGFFVLDITGNSVHHYASPAALAGIPPGLNLPNNTQIYTTQQAVTAVIPVDKRHGVRVATTYLWGALDYPQSGPFPYYYGIFIVSATKQFNNIFGITVVDANVIQREQGYPFPAPNAIRTNGLNVTADFHLDFNRLLQAPAPAIPGRPTQPGIPGGPGGPAQVGPSQGGTVSPSPAPGMSAAPMMAPASPAPAMMPTASPAPAMMPTASPAPAMMPTASPAPAMMPTVSPAPAMMPTVSPAPAMMPTTAPIMPAPSPTP